MNYYKFYEKQKILSKIHLKKMYVWIIIMLTFKAFAATDFFYEFKLWKINHLYSLRVDVLKIILFKEIM